MIFERKQFKLQDVGSTNGTPPARTHSRPPKNSPGRLLPFGPSPRNPRAVCRAGTYATRGDNNTFKLKKSKNHILKVRATHVLT